MAEMGSDPELRLSLGSGYRIRLVSSLKAGSGCFVSPVDSFFFSGCVEFRVEQQRRQTQQKKMTIFYQGRVCVCDATEMQARAIISMAKREMEDTVTTKQQRQSKEEEEEESSSRAVALQVLDPGLSMKRSLQRFLQKRKARVSDATPLGQQQKLLQFPIKLQRA
ncbi:tify domain [Musa troglodytarum]|uniref:Tify domain n=1 Tax=Musa troglodytarum TaxID=320322 RepID=A0A9E7L4M2_9LILI|nr:tify domain [Musa troglodytarum]